MPIDSRVVARSAEASLHQISSQSCKHLSHVSLGQRRADDENETKRGL